MSKVPSRFTATVSYLQWLFQQILPSAMVFQTLKDLHMPHYAVPLTLKAGIFFSRYKVGREWAVKISDRPSDRKLIHFSRSSMKIIPVKVCNKFARIFTIQGIL